MQVYPCFSLLASSINALCSCYALLVNFFSLLRNKTHTSKYNLSAEDANKRKLVEIAYNVLSTVTMATIAAISFGIQIKLHYLSIHCCAGAHCFYHLKFCLLVTVVRFSIQQQAKCIFFAHHRITCRFCTYTM